MIHDFPVHSNESESNDCIMYICESLPFLFDPSLLYIYMEKKLLPPNVNDSRGIVMSGRFKGFAFFPYIVCTIYHNPYICKVVNTKPRI